MEKKRKGTKWDKGKERKGGGPVKCKVCFIDTWSLHSLNSFEMLVPFTF